MEVLELLKQIFQSYSKKATGLVFFCGHGVRAIDKLAGGTAGVISELVLPLL